MRKPNQGQLTADKMGHLQTSITKLITWAQILDPSFPRHFGPSSPLHNSQPTTQRAGGVGLYIRNGIQFSVRHDLTSSTGESEMLWVEIESDLDSNMICGVVYRHPS